MNGFYFVFVPGSKWNVAHITFNWERSHQENRDLFSESASSAFDIVCVYMCVCSRVYYKQLSESEIFLLELDWLTTGNICFQLPAFALSSPRSLTEQFCGARSRLKCTTIIHRHNWNDVIEWWQWVNWYYCGMLEPYDWCFFISIWFILKIDTYIHTTQ